MNTVLGFMLAGEKQDKRTDQLTERINDRFVDNKTSDLFEIIHLQTKFSRVFYGLMDHF